MMAHRGAQQRLGSLLLRLATSRGSRSRVGRRETATVSVSHNELAQLAGMSRPHVTVTVGRAPSVVAGSCSMSVKVWFVSKWHRSPSISVATFDVRASGKRARTE
jgi:Crp-like helix-turn-helix protein